MVSMVGAFFRLSFKDKTLFFEAVVLLFSAKLILTVMPFRYCVKTISKKEFKEEPGIERLERIKRSLTRANRLAFWRNVCLVQSFAGKWMLQRRGIGSDLYIGMNKDEKGNFSAHAWLKAGGLEITYDGGDYHELHVL